MALALWNCLITLLWPLIYLYRPFRGTVGRRLGNFALEGYNPDSTGLKVLINAVSAGEVVAIASFVQELRRQLPDVQIALLTTTESGQTMARDKLGDSIDLLAFFPLIDLPFVVRRYLDKLQPDIYITTEAEVWPNIQNACQRRGIPVALVNARVYMHNKRGARLWLVRRLYSYCDAIICQDETHRANFIKLGVPGGKLSVSGNTKFDFKLAEWSAGRLADWRARHGIAADGKVAVAGSTHPGEEELVLAAWRELSPRPRLVLVPRHIERADEAAGLCRRAGLTAQTLAEHEESAQEWDVLVVDRYGVLVDYYRLADAVVMGGTFHPKVGGHNILEATVLGKPVIIGPYQYSISAQVEMLRRADAVIEVDDTVAGAADSVPPWHSGTLAEALTHLLAGPQWARDIGNRAREVTLANRGAAKRAVDAVLALLRG